VSVSASAWADKLSSISIISIYVVIFVSVFIFIVHITTTSPAACGMRSKLNHLNLYVAS
jgi:hypothetical protein